MWQKGPADGDEGEPGPVIRKVTELDPEAVAPVDVTQTYWICMRSRMDEKESLELVKHIELVQQFFENRSGLRTERSIAFKDIVRVPRSGPEAAGGRVDRKRCGGF